MSTLHTAPASVWHQGWRTDLAPRAGVPYAAGQVAPSALVALAARLDHGGTKRPRRISRGLKNPPEEEEEERGLFAPTDPVRSGNLDFFKREPAPRVVGPGLGKARIRNRERMGRALSRPYPPPAVRGAPDSRADRRGNSFGARSVHMADASTSQRGGRLGHRGRDRDCLCRRCSRSGNCIRR